MKIRKTALEDLQDVMKIYESARKFMVANGNPNQWSKNNWPPEKLISEDINNGKSYVCENDNGKIVGVFYYDYGHKIEPTYEVIENGKWIGSDDYGVVHRIATDSNERGVGTFCINYALDKCSHIRIDTHEDNIPMQRLLDKLKFIKCGIIYVHDGKDPRLAYERIV